MRSKANVEPLLGCHLSIGKGFPAAIDVAEDLGNSALQIFTHNASQWRMKPITAERIEAFAVRRSASSIRFVVAHTMYLLNLASPVDSLYERSIDALCEEMRRAAALGLDAVVTHLGAHVGSGSDSGIERIVGALKRVLAATATGDGDTPRLLVENTAGSGTTIGGTFEELAAIVEQVKATGDLGVCLDTAHAFAAGYDLSCSEAVEKTLERFDRALGLDRLALIHLNDSKYACGSRRDRHEHIGWGAIGRDGIGALVSHPATRSLPIILETPKEADGRKDADRMNLAVVRSLMQDEPDNSEGDA